MIYLDNAATSFPKPERVYVEMDKCMRQYCANPGRSGHRLALEAGRAIYLSLIHNHRAHETVLDLVCRLMLEKK